MRRSVVFLLGLLAISLWSHSRALDGALWIDEAISHGIASHGVSEIPAVLRQDGSPPLYYLLLRGWSGLFGAGEVALRSLSLVAALLTVPAALWAGSVAGGRRAGWIAAALAALNPFLVIYAQEARMYALVALLSVLACGSFLRGFVDGDSRHRALFALELAALLYTHAWAIFLALGFATAAAVHLRRRPSEAVLPFAAAALAFGPWVPTLVEQARHTGAPWSQTPSAAALLGAIPGTLDGGGGAAAVIAIGALGFAHARRDRRAAGVLQLLGLASVIALGVAWASSHVEPSWANRYLAIVVGPVLVLGAVGLARAGRIGLLAAVGVSALWLVSGAPADKSNVRATAAAVGPLPGGTLVVATQPEQVPLLHYYLGGDPAFATPLGRVTDPRVMDWRDALPRLRSSGSPAPGDAKKVALVLPLGGRAGWDAPWQREVTRVSRSWERWFRESPRYRLVRAVHAPRVERSRTDVKLLLFERV